MRPDCAACCFFRIVDGKRRLCQLTGTRRPIAGGAGCQFVTGRWEQLDAILGLPTAKDCGNTDLPNVTKQGNGLPNVTAIAIDDFSENPISHIAAKAERRFTVPVSVRTGSVTLGRL